MSSRILIYEGSQSPEPHTYQLNYAGNWEDLATGVAATAAPDAGDYLFFGAGSPSAISEGFDVAGVVLAGGANVTFAGEGAFITGHADIGSLLLLPGSAATFSGIALDAQDAMLMPGSTLTVETAPLQAPQAIGELFNLDGTIEVPPLSVANLLIGGPGFMQSGIATGGESNLHAGTGDWINLGNITQGSSVAVALDLQNQSGHDIADKSFATWCNGGFSFSGFDATSVANGATAMNVGSVTVDTDKLGTHMAAVRCGPYAVSIIDNVVA